jgi:hypothetical protein
MTTTFEALTAIAERLPRTMMGVATGGGEDASEYLYIEDEVNLVLMDDDAFVGGALLIESGDCEGAVLPVRDSVQATGRVAGDQRFWEQYTDETPAAGDLYLVTAGLYGPALLLRALREALQAWGLVEVEEELAVGDGETTTFWQTSEGEIVRIYIADEDGDPVMERAHWEAVEGGVELESAPADDTWVRAVIARSAERGLTLPPTRYTLNEELGDVPSDFIGYYGAGVCTRAALGAPGQDQDLMIKLTNYYNELAAAAKQQAQKARVRSRERLMR